MKKATVGIDIGGTNTKFGLVDRNGDCINRSAIKTRGHGNIESYLFALSNAITQIIEKSGSHEAIGIGIGAPNGNYFRGTIEHAPNLEWKGVIPLAEKLKTLTGLPSVLTNDANAAAMGEMIYGGAKAMKDFIVITLGTGVGSGIVVNGELVYGHDGFAGEIGHTIVNPMGRECGCGRKGCLETYASATGIVRTALEFLQNPKEQSSLRKIPENELSAKHIFEAADSGDILSLKIFGYTGKILGMKLADTVAHTSPEAIFLFGGLASAGKFIFEPTKNYMEKYLLGIFKNKVKLLPSKLNGADAAILGASALAWKEFS